MDFLSQTGVWSCSQNYSWMQTCRPHVSRVFPPSRHWRIYSIRGCLDM